MVHQAGRMRKLDNQGDEAVARREEIATLVARIDARMSAVGISSDAELCRRAGLRVDYVNNIRRTRYAARVVTEILRLPYPQEKQGSASAVASAHSARINEITYLRQESSIYSRPPHINLVVL